jgi:hypothetical protein
MPDIRLLAGVVCFFLWYLFYRAALSAAITYGHYVRTCFDLFRLDLLAPLGIDLPTGLQDEKTLWREVHEFLTLGEGSPYKLQARRASSGSLLYTAGRLARIGSALVFWRVVRLVLVWVSRHPDVRQARASLAGMGSRPEQPESLHSRAARREIGLAG